MLELRPFQREAIDSLYTFWGAQPDGNPLLVIPTGGGKSLIIAKACEEFITAEPQTRIVQVTHVKELIEQNFKEMIGEWPWAPAGIYSASLGRREAHSQIIFAGIQTVFRQAKRIGHVDLLIVDEAHLIPRNTETMYGRFIKELREINPNMLVLGLTATPYRLDSGRLDEGEDKLFDQITYEITIKELIDLGYLVPLVSKGTTTQLNVKGVGRRGGDFIASALQAAVDQHPITAAAVDEIIAFGESRRAWLCFCAGVDHAKHVADEFEARGYTAAVVTGDMDKRERNRIITDYRAGKIKVLTNANVLTTGFNAPIVDLAAMLRPTESTSLYVQMVGRGTRCIGKDIEESIRNGKKDCLILDFAGNVRRHGPVDCVEPKKAGSGEGEAPVKECPVCRSLIFAGLRQCPDCGHVFETADFDEKIKKTADAVPILSTGKPEWINVTRRTFFRHDKPGGTPSVRVEYLCGLVIHKEWICPQHHGYARAKFEKWWEEHGGGKSAPFTVEATLAAVKALKQTSEIRIRPNGKFWEIVGRHLTDGSAPDEEPAPTLHPWQRPASQPSSPPSWGRATPHRDDEIPF